MLNLIHLEEQRAELPMSASAMPSGSFDSHRSGALVSAGPSFSPDIGGARLRGAALMELVQSQNPRGMCYPCSRGQVGTQGAQEHHGHVFEQGAQGGIADSCTNTVTAAQGNLPPLCKQH